MQNRAVFMTDLRKFEIREIGMPEIGSEDVLVKLEYIGICGSDIHYFEKGRIGGCVVEMPYILGHECAGSVVAIGDKVEHLKVGDRVALEPGQTCGKCEFCKEGKYNLCPDVVFLATPPYQGAMMNYIAYPEHMAFKLPDNVSSMEGALVEPLAVGIHAARQGEVTLGTTVFVIGAGCIGLVSLLACRSFGACQIIISDVYDKRLEKARKLGATNIINAAKEDVVARVNEITNGRGVDVIIETSGNPTAIGQTVHIAKRGGTIIMIGLSPLDNVEYNFVRMIDKEIQIKSVFRYRNIYNIAINAIGSGKINIKDIVTHQFDFENSQEAFESASNSKQEVIKGVIRL